MALPLRLYCVPKATPRRSSAIQMRLCYVLCVLTATLRRLLRLSGDCPATVRMYYVYCVLIASLLRCYCDYGDSTAIPRRPNQDSERMQRFCDCFLHVQNIRRRSATLCVLGFLATTSLRPCCVHGDCAASWLVTGRSKDAVRSRGMCEGSFKWLHHNSLCLCNEFYYFEQKYWIIPLETKRNTYFDNLSTFNIMLWWSELTKIELK